MFDIPNEEVIPFEYTISKKKISWPSISGLEGLNTLACLSTFPSRMDYENYLNFRHLRFHFNSEMISHIEENYKEFSFSSICECIIYIINNIYIYSYKQNNNIQ